MQLVLENKLLERCIVSSQGCIEWAGYRTVDGYGHIKIKGKIWKTHRLSYTLFIGGIPEGKCVLHKCDNPACCNPNHLFLGDWNDNNKDRATKGRSAVGERSGRAKLTDYQVGQVRELYSTGEYTQVSLGYKYGVSSHQIGMIVHGKSRVV